MSEPQFPNESPDYRAARDLLLKEEQALVDKVKSVAAKRRNLPRGIAQIGEVVRIVLAARGLSLEERLGALGQFGNPWIRMVVIQWIDGVVRFQRCDQFAHHATEFVRARCGQFVLFKRIRCKIEELIV